MRVFAALERVCTGRGRVERFADCGSFAWVFVDPADHGRFSVRASLCHDRFCVPCAAARGREVAAVIAEHAKNRRILFVTLTLRSSDAPLADQLTRLYRSFAALRRWAVWRATVRGGVAICEVTYNASRGAWHPHLHVLAEGTWIPHADLRSAWHRITSDSHVVDVRLARTTDDLAGYVAKYLAKPLASSYIRRPDQLQEALIAFSGRKVCMTFGSWRGVRLHLPPDNTPWEPIAPLVEILDAARSGSQWAGQILDRLRTPYTWQSNESTRASPAVETICSA
jgi:hypothetical protein